MILPDGLLLLLFAVISLFSAAAGVSIVGMLQRHIVKRRAGRSGVPSSHVTADGQRHLMRVHRYAFKGGHLVSNIDADDAFLHPRTKASAALDDLKIALTPLHPEIPDRFSALVHRGEGFALLADDGKWTAFIEGLVKDGALVVNLVPLGASAQFKPGEPPPVAGLQRELDDLRSGMELVGDVVWKLDADGHVTWANSRYCSIAETALGQPSAGLGNALPQIFGDQLEPPPVDGTVRRCQVEGDRPLPESWYEVSALQLNNGERLFAARSVGRLVAAENGLRQFVQTLSKTFATLPTGLAVFDRKRELMMFNPALVAISGLEPGFLSNRPPLRAFLDRLRDQQRMPEPRDYRTWREEIADLEQGAEEGRYHELWTLPGGETLRVTGHPHPDGAIAFLFDDISQEMVLTRQFRSDLDLDRAILNDVGAAFVVFDRDGRITRSNAAYRTMFGVRTAEDGTVTETVTDAAARWQDQVAPARLWGEIRMFVRHELDRAAWAELVPMADGTGVHCRIAPLAGGLTIVWFLSSEADRSDPFATSVWPDVPSRAAVDMQAVEEKRKEGVA